MNVISRRGALGSMAGVVAGVRALRADELSDFIAADERSTQTSFFFVTDTHYLADKQKSAAMDSRSATICRRLVQTLNSLEGQPIPGHAGDIDGDGVIDWMVGAPTYDGTNTAEGRLYIFPSNH